MAKDENEGMGGSYMVDPKTGKRKLIERTVEKDIVPPAKNEYDNPKSAQASGDE